MRPLNLMTYIFLMLITLSSCTKFLDVEPKGIVLPEKTEDYENMLNSEAVTISFAPSLIYMTDDFYQNYDALNTSVEANSYYWRPELDADEKENPAVWGDLYKSIYYTNVIVNNVMASSGGNTQHRESILSEALVFRADNYLTLLTVFAKAYNSQTAKTDAGVPIVTTTDVTAKVPGRSSVEVVLDMLIDDLKKAATSLPVSNLNRYRVTKQAAHAMLSRVFLYMHNYEQAKLYAEMALQAPHSILDYNDYPTPDDFPVTDLKPDILWQRSSQNYDIPSFQPMSEDLKTYFNDNDLRFLLFTTEVPNGLAWLAPSGWANFGITYQEMELTRAECLARQGNTEDAMDIINNIRKNRIVAASYTDQIANSAEEALTKVLAERRRELAYGGLRWFDMKRLDQEGRMPQVDRINSETHAIEASLPPHSPKYTFEIPRRVIMFNPDMQLNNR